MPTLRLTFLICSLTFAGLVVPCARGQNPGPSTDQPQDQTQTQTASQVPPEPALVPVPAITTNLPPGMLTFNAACFTITANGQITPLAGVAEGECYSRDKSGTLVPTYTRRVSLRDDVAGQFTQLGTQADGNYKLVQQAVLHAIVQVLADQSIKADQVAAIVKTTSDQISSKVTQNLQNNLATLVSQEVAKQIKAINLTASPQPTKQSKPSGDKK